MSGLVAGRDAIHIMVEEIGDAIGQRRLREFESKVRTYLRAHGGTRNRTASEWVAAMAEVIVADDDKKANDGFMKGIHRIRANAERR